MGEVTLVYSLAPTTGTFPKHRSHFVYLVTHFMDLQMIVPNPLTNILPPDRFPGDIEPLSGCQDVKEMIPVLWKCISS